MLVLQGCGGGGDSPGAVTTVTTTTTLSEGPGGLYFCEDLSTYYKVTYDSNSTKSAFGQCMPSTAPGAYYTSPGAKDTDGKSDKSWGCFNADFNKDLWTNEEAKAQGFTGACLMRDYGSSATRDTVDKCSEHLSHHPANCAPGPSMYWGACWSSHSENWKCVPVNDGTIDSLAKGDCTAEVLQTKSGSPTKHFYDGVCRFEPETTKVYKCDTVTTYCEETAGTCGQSVDETDDKACFSLDPDVQWSCISPKKTWTTPCDWLLEPGTDNTKGFYKGACVFSQNKEYKHALDAGNLSAISNRAIVV